MFLDFGEILLVYGNLEKLIGLIKYIKVYRIEGIESRGVRVYLL